MTNQEMFDKAVAGLAGQGFERAMGTGKHPGRCAYLAEDGKRCAIGHCLTDEQARYADRTLQSGFTVASRLWALTPGEGGDDGFFPTRLQGAHDDSDTPAVMREKLRLVGERFGLTIPEVLR